MAVEWKPFSPKALDYIRNSDARLNIAYGAVRSGKTISTTVRFIKYILEGPPGDLALLGRTTATLQRNVLNDLMDLVGSSNFKWRNRQSGELFVFGRRLWTFGANNEDAEAKLRGATFAGAVCDEVTTFPQSVFNQLIARCSVTGASIFTTTNPDSPYHWFHTDFVQNEKITNKKVWHFTMHDNLSLSDEYVENLKQTYTGVWYDRMVLGLWVAADGRIYDMFDPAVHTFTSRELPGIAKYLVSCDYGTSSVMTWSLIAKTYAGAYYKIGEYYYDAVKEKVQMTDSQFGNAFESWLKLYDVQYRLSAIYVDPSAASWKAELRYRGYHVMDADNDVINGIRHVSKLLSQQRFFVHTSCENTVKEYLEYSWDQDEQKKGKDKPIKLRDHTCDADRYALYSDSLYGESGVYQMGGK